MTEFYFMIRHTPFWAIPVLILALEFGYVFWLRKKWLNLKICSFVALVSLVALGWYYAAGGPDKAVRKLIKLQRTIEL